MIAMLGINTVALTNASIVHMIVPDVRRPHVNEKVSGRVPKPKRTALKILKRRREQEATDSIERARPC